MSKYLVIAINFGNLNKEQAKILAGFYIDIAKALVISAIGLGFTTPLLTNKLFIGIINFAFAYIFVKISLEILKK